MKYAALSHYHELGVLYQIDMKYAGTIHKEGSFYKLTLRVPIISCRDKESVSYLTKGFIFTQKELNRACVRHYASTVPESRDEEIIRHYALGYVNVYTYINYSGIPITRFNIKYRNTDHPQVPIYGIFTARELRRAMERNERHELSNRHPFFGAIVSIFRRFKHAR